MANSTFNLRPAPHGSRAEMSGLGGGRIRWTMTPELTWIARVRHTDLANADQVTTVTIPALTDSGRLTGTFSRGGVVVAVAADLDDGDDQDGLATTFAAALEAEGAPFSSWLASATPGPGSGQVTIEWATGIGLVSPAFVFQPAQILELVYDGGELVAGRYVFTFSGAALGGPVEVVLPWGGGTAADFGVALEAAIEGEAQLDGAVVSANDNGAGSCAVLFLPGLPSGAIAVEVPAIAHSYVQTTGGVAADGDYVVTFLSELLPAPVPVTVTRVGGAPATNANIAAAFEAAIEANPQLAPYVASADDTGAANEIETYPGVSFAFETSAPTGATLGVVDVSDPAPSYVSTSATPAAPTITQSHDLALALNELVSGFPANACRLECPCVRRIVAWSHTATIRVDDGGEASTDVLDDVSISSGTGWAGGTGSSVGDVDVAHAAWDPRLVITTASLAPSAGEFEIHVGFCPLPPDGAVRD